MLNTIMQFCGKKEVTIASVFVVIVVLISVLSWTDIRYMSRAEAKDGIAANTLMLEKHIVVYESDKKQAARNDIAKAIRDTQAEQSQLRLMVSFNGENDLTKETEITLKNRLTRQEGVEGCMISGGDNCVADNP